MEGFGRLPEECISEIMSYTSALDASRSSILSKEFRSAASNDVVWDRFLPPDYEDIVSASVSPVTYDTKKQLYLSLCDYPILINGGKMSFCLDKRNGKKCVMVGARQLLISWKSCWDFTPHSNSRFSEVAELRSIGWVHIEGKTTTEMLSKDTEYAAYLVFWVGRMDGLKSSNTVIRFRKGKSKIDTMNERFESRETGKLAKMRGDGWMEIELGKFYNDDSDDGEVEAWFTQISSPIGMSGLVVEGVEFRPL